MDLRTYKGMKAIFPLLCNMEVKQTMSTVFLHNWKQPYFEVVSIRNKLLSERHSPHFAYMIEKTHFKFDAEVD